MRFSKSLKINLDKLNLISKAYLVNINQYKNISFLKEILKEYRNEDWKNYLHLLENKEYNNFNYKKIIIPLNYNSNHDLYNSHTSLSINLIKWGVNSESPIHNHEEYGCCLKILEGELKEYIYDKNLKLINKNIIKKNDVSYIDNNIGYHKIRNPSNNNNVYSLHIYAGNVNSNKEIKYFEV